MVEGSGDSTARSSGDGRKLWRCQKVLEGVEGSGGVRRLQRQQARNSGGGRKLWMAAEVPGGGQRLWRGSKSSGGSKHEALETAGSFGRSMKLWRWSKAVVEAVGSGGVRELWRRLQGLGGICRPSHTRHPPAAACDSPPTHHPRLALRPARHRRDLALAHHPTYAARHRGTWVSPFPLDYACGGGLEAWRSCRHGAAKVWRLWRHGLGVWRACRYGGVEGVQVDRQGGLEAQSRGKR